MEQTKALNALEPFLALTKSATSQRAAVDLITRATSAPNTFIFTELLLAPQIQALAHTSDAPYLTILKIFCYDTYEIYRSTSDLPPLSAAQTLKLRQLSLLALAQNPDNLTYKRLISVLELDSASDLETLVIAAIYAGLLIGTLDPHNQRVCISSTSPLRDVSPSSIPRLISTLQEWSGRCTSTLSNLDKQIAAIKSEAARRRKEETEWDAKLEKMIDGTASGKETKGGRGGKGEGPVKRGFFGGPDAEGCDMDVDSDDDETDDRKGTAGLKKKRGLAGTALHLGFGR